MGEPKKEDTYVWMVRAGSGSWLIDEFLDEEIVAIGWNELGDLHDYDDFFDLKEHIIETYGDEWSAGKINQTTGQIHRLVNEFQIGDNVVTYDSNSRLYYIGEILSKYKYDEDYTFHHYREIEWRDEGIDRDLLSVSSKNSLGSILTIFEVYPEIWEDLCKNHVSYISKEELEEDRVILQHLESQELEEVKQDTISRSTEFIKDIITKLDWSELEKLFAGIMQAMGYKARLTGRGPDMGSDIVASPDGLEMVEPIIKIEVKHRIKSKKKIGAPEIRSFVGGLRNTTKGIYVSSTGFAKDAKMEAERANFQITLVDLDRLVELLVEYYEELDSETKALVPLKRIYWPV